ncbi:MAG: ribose-phosphate diphosphokinase [Anaerolineae bacterium]
MDEKKNTEDLEGKVLVFSGTANPQLARDIAGYLGLKLSPTTVRKFTNDNFYVQLGVSVRAKEIFIVQPFSPPCSDNILELCLMLDIARGAGAKSVQAVIPYYSYARSDKKDAPRISITARLIADLLATSGATHVITMTLHSPQVHGFFSVPADHLTAHSVFVKHLQNQDLSNAVVVSPDIGHAKRALKLAKALKLPAAAAEKRRLDGKHVTIDGMMGNVYGKRVLLVDDEIATGGTIVETIRYLRKEAVTRVTVIGTHGLFAGDAVEELNAIPEIDEIVVTDTVYIPEKRQPARLTILPVGHIFGEVIRRNVQGQSVGELFEFWPLPDGSQSA